MSRPPGRTKSMSEGGDLVRLVRIPDDYRDLLDQPVVAMLATADADGRVAVSPIWVELVDDATVRFSSLAATLKSRQLLENRNVALCLLDPGDAYRFLELRGVVTDVSSDGAHNHLDAMTQRYWGQPAYPGHDYSAPRLLFTMRVDRVATG
jgi:PPOX class probable F420-dependent enzyme